MEPHVGSETTGSKNLVPIIVCSVLVSALVAVGGAYAYQRRQNDKQTADLRSQITTLQQHVSVLKTPTPTPRKYCYSHSLFDRASGSNSFNCNKP